MDCLPDTVLVEVLSFLPQKAFLPIGHVSKRFRDTWLDMKMVPGGVFGFVDDRRMRIIFYEANQNRNEIISLGSSTQSENNKKERRNSYLSSPLQDGNLFDPMRDESRQHHPLRTSLLEYYISNGWNNPSRFQLVLHAAAARGDIEGMKYLLRRGICCIKDKEICTAAGRAGQLDSLLWLREKGCPWDAAEVFREASDKSHHSVMKYVYLNSGDNDLPLGLETVGMPW